MNELAEMYPEIKKEIDGLVMSIREHVKCADPLNLLNFLISMNQMSMLNKPSEAMLSADDVFQLRTVEYIQSVLVSTPSEFVESGELVDQTHLFFLILEETSQLYEKMQLFYLIWGSKENDLDNNAHEYVMLAQMMSQVRGNQYQNYQIPVMRALLEPQDDLIQQTYHVDAYTIIQGLERLEKNLSSGRLDAAKKFGDFLDKYESVELSDECLDQGRGLFMQSIGVDLFDVKKATGWPDDLLNDLSLEIGEDESLFSHEEYNGWPLWNLPVQIKPCIKINDTVYTFDYYNFFDNFYRAFQKAICARNPKGNSLWNESQKLASEQTVGNIFAELLPECVIHYGNYYSIGNHNSAENDLLIEYKDVLFIIEVKAGSFTYTPAITDFDAHKKSLISLVEKAEQQCFRVKEYIENNDVATFFDGDDLKREAFSITRSNYTQLYMLDITVSDFNELAAQMEKIHIANTKENIIALSMNDLWVYKEYFDNPAIFIHFIKQRMNATQLESLVAFDELDHLGLYIEYNMYSITVRNMAADADSVVYFEGFREELDIYFSDLYRGKETEKPAQEIPEIINRIIEICNNKRKRDNAQFTNFLLDMSSDSRQNFCESVKQLSRRQIELKKMIPAFASGDTNYCLFINQPGIAHISQDEQVEYVLATLAKNESKACYLIELHFSNDGEIIDIDFNFLTQDNILPEDRERLLILGNSIYESRLKSILRQQKKKKIGRNDPCPCGSGRKYKQCCIGK